MGQKMNPLGFRLAVTQNLHSYWFAQPKMYLKLLREDREMCNCIEIYVRKHIRSSSNYEGIARIEIKRKTNLIQVGATIKARIVSCAITFKFILVQPLCLRFSLIKSTIE
jgi:hypothetical protein